jgi:hypothetical protein
MDCLINNKDSLYARPDLGYDPVPANRLLRQAQQRKVQAVQSDERDAFQRESSANFQKE